MSLTMWDSDTATVAWLQAQLNTLGFGPIAVDGAYGPQTASAVAAYQSSHGLPASGIYDPQTEAAFASAAGPTSTGASAQDLIRAVYPQIAWAYAIPEVRAVIDAAVAGNWDPARIIGAIEATAWWQTTSASQRTWQQQLAEDPATATARRAQTTASLSDQASQLGLTLDAATLDSLSEQALSLGMTGTQITDMLVAQSGGTFGPGTVANTQNQLRSMASAYAVPVSDQSLSTWAAQIASGAQTQEGFLSYVTEQAKSMFPSLTAAIDSGITVAQYAEPYKQIAVQQLGINPAEFNLADPRWSRAIYQIDPQTSMGAAMNLSDWTTTIRSDASYGYDTTPGAVSSAVALADQLRGALGYG